MESLAELDKLERMPDGKKMDEKGMRDDRVYIPHEEKGRKITK